MKSEPTISTQKFVAEWGGIYVSSKQTNIKLYSVKIFLNPVEIGRYLAIYLDGIIIIQKQYLAWICNQILSKACLKIIMVELSMPYESWWSKATSIKLANLKKELEKEGYSVTVKAVKMGARGFVAGNLNQFLGQIGIKGPNRPKCIRCLIEIMENNFIWNNSK